MSHTSLMNKMKTIRQQHNDGLISYAEMLAHYHSLIGEEMEKHIKTLIIEAKQVKSNLDLLGSYVGLPMSDTKSGLPSGRATVEMLKDLEEKSKPSMKDGDVIRCIKKTKGFTVGYLYVACYTGSDTSKHFNLYNDNNDYVTEEKSSFKVVEDK